MPCSVGGEKWDKKIVNYVFIKTVRRREKVYAQIIFVRTVQYIRKEGIQFSVFAWTKKKKSKTAVFIADRVEFLCQLLK